MEGSEASSGEDRPPTRGETLALVGITLAIAIAGALLYAAGYNEGFYSHTAWVRGVFEALSDLGDEKLYLVGFCIAFLAYDMRFGKRLAWVFFATLFAGDLLKQLVQDPRPAFNGLRSEPVTGWGFPSGHTTTSVSFYGYILLDRRHMGRRGLPLAGACLFAMVVVPVSRMVIGAHDLQDVVGGVVVSLALLTGYMLVRPRASRAIDSLSLGARILVQVGGVLALWGVGLVALVLRHPGELGTFMEELGQPTGLLLGCAVAFPLEEAYVGYRPDLLDARRRLVAAVAGTVLTVGIYAGAAGAGEAILPSPVADLVTYFVLIMLLALVAPYLLRRLWPEAAASDAVPKA